MWVGSLFQAVAGKEGCIEAGGGGGEEGGCGEAATGGRRECVGRMGGRTLADTGRTKVGGRMG